MCHLPLFKVSHCCNATGKFCYLGGKFCFSVFPSHFQKNHIRNAPESLKNRKCKDSVFFQRKRRGCEP